QAVCAHEVVDLADLGDQRRALRAHARDPLRALGAAALLDEVAHGPVGGAGLQEVAARRCENSAPAVTEALAGLAVAVAETALLGEADRDVHRNRCVLAVPAAVTVELPHVGKEL